MTGAIDGRAAIHKYWFDVTRPQSQITGIQGAPIVEGNRAAIEIWVKFVDPQYNPNGKHRITLLETNVLTFARGGLVTKNVEYWNIIIGWHSPPPGWGERPTPERRLSLAAARDRRRRDFARISSRPVTR